MKDHWLYIIGVFAAAGLSMLIAGRARAQGDVPPPSPDDCVPAVANQFTPTDGSDIDLNTVESGILLVRWGDADGDGNAGDQIILRVVDIPSGGRQLVREVYLAQWTTSCQLQQTCPEPTPPPGCNNGGSGGMGPNGEPCAPAAAPNPPPSYVVNPDIDAPPDCALIEITEYGMKCYPTCSTSTTEGGVACLGVQREPYPRGMVSVPNVYIVLGPYSKDGNTAVCPDPSLEYPLYRNRTLKVVWEMDMSIPPAWFFDERPWNIQKGVSNQAFGFEVEHTFETSSYPTGESDKPYIGPSTTNELLPAYLVRLDTWWIGSVIREWDEYYWHEEYEDVSCTYNPGAPNHDPACNPNGMKSVMKPGFPEYRFRGHIVAKDQIDLRAWGWPTSKLYSRSGWDPRQSVAGIPPQYLCRYIPTPILESQAVITTDGNP